MCRVLGVSRQGYYHYRRNIENSLTNPEHQEMLRLVKQIATESDYSYGRRRMKRAMNALGFPISRTETVNLMKEAKAQVRHKKKFKVTTNSNHKLPLFDNLLKRQFDVAQPDQVYASDITYSVPGVQGKQGCLNEPRVYLEYAINLARCWNTCIRTWLCRYMSLSGSDLLYAGKVM